MHTQKEVAVVQRIVREERSDQMLHTRAHIERVRAGLQRAGRSGAERRSRPVAVLGVRRSARAAAPSEQRLAKPARHPSV